MRWPRIYRKFQFNLFDWDLVVKLNRPTVSPAPWLKTPLLPSCLPRERAWVGSNYAEMRDVGLTLIAPDAGHGAGAAVGPLVTRHPSPLATSEHLHCTGPGLMLYCQYLLTPTPLPSPTSKSPLILHQAPCTVSPGARSQWPGSCVSGSRR